MAEWGQQFSNLIEEQGWDEDSVDAIVAGFITAQGLHEELGRYAAGIADMENSAEWDAHQQRLMEQGPPDPPDARHEHDESL